jgi:hypothetical protein
MTALSALLSLVNNTLNVCSVKPCLKRSGRFGLEAGVRCAEVQRQLSADTDLCKVAAPDALKRGSE